MVLEGIFGAFGSAAPAVMVAALAVVGYVAIKKDWFGRTRINAPQTGFRGDKRLFGQIIGLGIKGTKKTMDMLHKLWQTGSVDQYESNLKEMLEKSHESVANIDRIGEELEKDVRKLGKTEIKEDRVEGDVEKDLEELEK